MWLLIAFIVVPLIEIALFIKVGGLIGLWPTLAIVLATAFAGSWLIRQQGARALAEVARAMPELRDPSGPMAHGALLVLAGALLLSPGFFTDTVGLLLLIPQVRQRIIRFLGARVRVAQFGPGFPRRGNGLDDDYIDADYDVIDPEARPRPTRPSGWTQR